MKHLLAIGFFCLFVCALNAQVTDTTVCDILKNPQSFNGKTVRIKGTVVAGFDEFVVKDSSCNQSVNAIWLSFPEGTKAKSGPEAMLLLEPASNFGGSVTPVARKPVTIEENKDFKQFDSLLSTPAKVKETCLGCVRYDVSATLVGRLDGTSAGLTRDSGGRIVGIRGFGNMNAYSARLVLQSVADVKPTEVDYSREPSATTGTPQTIASEFGGGQPLQDQPKRAVAAYGKEGDDNGVSVGGLQNNASDAAEAKQSQSSPDGVIFNCMYDFSRLKGNLMGSAMAHMGEHIADLRNPEAGTDSTSTYQLEFRAWVTTILSGIGNGEKSLELPGGYTIWKSSWSSASMNANTQSALLEFLRDEASLTR